MKNRAVFLDRDGTLNKDAGYLNSFNQVEIFPDSFKAVRRINKAGLLAVIVTNQSGIGRGLIQEKTLKTIHRKLEASFAQQEAYFAGIYYCPHYHSSNDPKYKKICSCRKPNPEMALKAAADLNIDVSTSYMVGDKVEDILFGRNINAKPILVMTGFGPKTLPKLKEKGITPAFIAPNLLEAVNWILHSEKSLCSPED
ncbi:D-glycero-alpha-D-manno-heptose-1,7-bisphosphate 7-phosphatase [Acidobacteriota bacterium]